TSMRLVVLLLTKLPPFREAVIQDMENFGNAMVKKNAVPVVRVHKRTRGERSPSPVAEPRDEYDVWLQGMKQKWRRMKEDRANRKNMFGVSAKKKGGSQ